MESAGICILLQAQIAVLHRSFHCSCIRCTEQVSQTKIGPSAAIPVI